MSQINKLKSNFLLFEKEFNENLSLIFRSIDNPDKFEYEKNLADFRYRNKRVLSNKNDLHLEDIINIKNKTVKTDSNKNLDKNRNLLLAFSSSNQTQDKKGDK